MIRSSVGWWLSSSKQRAIQLQATYPATPNVYGDIGLTQRALSNLLDNALRNTPQGGIVIVEVCTDGDVIQLAVADTGWGIAADELVLVTQRFYRTAQSRSSAVSGSGLGLAIAREIVELHGATLRLESQLQVGTRASFTLQAACE